MNLDSRFWFSITLFSFLAQEKYSVSLRYSCVRVRNDPTLAQRIIMYYTSYIRHKHINNMYE